MLKADTTSTYGPELISTIDYGVPNKEETRAFPFCYVTFESEDDVPQEGIANNAATVSYHTVRYIIVVVDAKNSGAEVDKALYGWQKAIKEQLKGNITLTDPSSPGSDPKVTLSWPRRTRALKPLEDRGQAVGGFAIVLECIIQTS